MAPVIMNTILAVVEILSESVILAKFLKKIRMCLFKVKHYLGHISGMVGPIDVKRDGKASIGYWV